MLQFYSIRLSERNSLWLNCLPSWMLQLKAAFWFILKQLVIVLLNQGLLSTCTASVQDHASYHVGFLGFRVTILYKFIIKEKN